MYSLDRIDRKILHELQRDGRISMTELAERVSLSTSPCTERVRRMERAGVIQGYHARVNPEALGRGLLVFVELTLSSKSADVFEKMRRELQHEPRVLECHLISGPFDYLVKARLSAMREYRDLLGQILSKVPVPAQSNSYVVMEEIKETLLLPVDPVAGN
ncbi:winged helix-turn-helix transcriptional regulator [Ottowia sp.]|uniref:winged helix-turn-helix transcriptional regulator n=1 Tax=Ottowia sp. TaxID=1898956 RepID=UPI002C715EF8|nr:winged helix-turn-helix transcriptional regulator [Ottowia sp.]HRN77136.1 winged helix-turn-helix transcriptional regulator [Ottowia sp.]HRQ03270.1 winged helix-turn-helix transcriptional regulator [Ottowia sp.]